MYKGSKTPHRPERCLDCFHGNPCRLYGRDMSTNKNGDPWENWACMRRSVIRKKPQTMRKKP